MTAIKYVGFAFIAVGVILLAYTLITAKRRGTFEAIRELRRIRANGYIREHKEERGENIYKRELATDHSRLMSRRAQRVLEKMEAEEHSKKQAGIQKGTALLEEVSAKPEEGTALLKDGKGTAVLESNTEKTAMLETGLPNEERTAILSEEHTAILGKGENTAVLTLEEDTGLLDNGESTDLLAEEGTAVLEDEGTALLQDKGTEVLTDKED